jgi:UDP-3-O-[3-hydroxymyristoyl] glucosamine N-acyltransferase
MRTLGELAQLTGGRVKGDPKLPISGFCSLDNPRPDCISFIEKKREADRLNGSALGAVVTSETLAAGFDNAIISGNPKLAFVHIAEAFLGVGHDLPSVGYIDPRALIDPSATVDPTARIEAAAMVEAGASIGPRSCIGAGTYIGKNTTVGGATLIHANVTVYHDCTIGSNVEIQGGTVIGAPGFGFVPSKDGHRRFPQVGTVLIEDDVVIGANCCVDRAALDVTIIRSGTRIDNLVQIAHGVEIGRNCLIAAQTGISGGTRIGDWVVVGGQAGFQGHIEVGSESVIAAQSGVFSDLEPKSKVSGYPARPHAQSLKILAMTFKLPEVMDKIRSLEIDLDIARGELKALREKCRILHPDGEALG